MAEMKRQIKDSVFTYLFRQPEYMLELYQSLHPEDTETAETDLKLVTLENVLSTGMYNDLRIQVEETLILLMEAQSTFSVNICLRMLLYLAETYKEYVEKHKLDLYAGKAVRFPRPKLYVVYTGGRADVPEVLRLSGLYEGRGSLEVTVRVLRTTGNRDIVDQYIRFCEISDAQRVKFGYTQKAINETIRLCLEQSILAPFLVSRQKEVTDIMITLFSQEKVTEIHEYNLAKETRDEPLTEGWHGACLRNLKSIMEKLGLSAEQAMDMLKVAEGERTAFLEQLSNP